MSELLANPNRRMRPHAPVSVPYRPSLRPIAIRRWTEIHRRRRIIVTRACDGGSDYGPCGEAVPAATSPPPACAGVIAALVQANNAAAVTRTSDLFISHPDLLRSSRGAA